MIIEKLENREQLESLKKNGKLIIEWGAGSDMGGTLCIFKAKYYLISLFLPDTGLIAARM